MKKYVKPELIFESFEMTQQIAACQYDSNNTHDDAACKFTGYNDEFEQNNTGKSAGWLKLKKLNDFPQIPKKNAITPYPSLLVI